MNRAQAYELAKARGFNKSISAFGGQFTKNPEAIVCGIKRIDRGVFVEVQEDSSVTVSINDDSKSIEYLPTKEEKPIAQESPQEITSTETPQPALSVDPSPINEEKPVAQESPQEITSTETPKPNNSSVKPLLKKENPVTQESPQEVTSTQTPPSDNSSVESSSKDEESTRKKPFEPRSDRPPRIRRKLYTANGTHQAICRFQGVLMPKPEGEKGFKLLLPGLEVEAHFAFPKTLWYYRQNPQIFEGVQNYIGYPKLTGEGKLVKIQIVAIDQEQSFQKEQWEFIGMWCGPQKALFVQRQGQMFPDEERPHYYKYRFKNQDEYRKYLWDRYAYHIIAKREGEELLILRNNPFACPRRKPEPPTRGKPPFRPSSAKPQGKPEGKPNVRSLPTLKS